MEKHYYLISVETGAKEQADQVIAERLNHDEFLGFQYEIDHKMVGTAPTRWWRVLDKDGKLWCETSNETEARQSMFEWDEKREEHTKKIDGMKLQRMHQLDLDLFVAWKDVE